MTSNTHTIIFYNDLNFYFDLNLYNTVGSKLSIYLAHYTIKIGGKQRQTTPENLLRMQCPRAIPVA